MSANFAQIEAVGAAGRTMGQKIFCSIGINPLVATGMGRRIAAYTFTKIGEDKIMKLVEDALRDPERAAFLLRRFRELPDWTPSPKAERLKSEVLSDPLAIAQRGAATATDRARDIGNFAGKYIKNHSLEAIERAVRFGLIPAQAGARALTVEQDWEKGAPYIYRDNKIRAYIEAIDEASQILGEGVDEPGAVGDQSSVQPAVLPERSSSQRMRDTIRSIGQRPSRPLVQGSSLDGVRLLEPPRTAQGQLPSPVQGQLPSPVQGQLPSPVQGQLPPTGRASQKTLTDLDQMGMPLFPEGRGTPFNKGGIVSIKRKPRQLVG